MVLVFLSLATIRTRDHVLPLINSAASCTIDGPTLFAFTDPLGLPTLDVESLVTQYFQFFMGLLLAMRHGDPG